MRTATPTPAVLPGRPHRRARSALAALLLVAPLAACGGGDEETAPAASSTPPATPSASPTPTPEPTPTEPVEVGARLEITAPGAVLGAGDAAVIEMHNGFDPAGPAYSEAQVTSRFVSVTVADPADLAGVDLPTPIDPATETVYYVRTQHTLEWARGLNLVSVSPPHVRAWDVDGAGASDLLVFGAFPACQSGRFTEHTPGETVEACDIAVLPSAQPLGYVGVPENPQLTRDAHEQYEVQPVLWQVPAAG
ncbi:hypothetical protein LFM56_16660 [Cellulomonas iranensis]|uniref:hypothetical protein n=1 Tax=Cellulomonas iranensis TaxID=76862 RepID=UPI001CF34F60|nr:hypothetical protein [Cellulomonas iranensis]UCN14471.1 hypothetical protein LFM56_16660 [Cellulomonas iranensis]